MNAEVCDDHVWATDGPDSNIYGLMPNYECCTANFNQGWPKFAARACMWMPNKAGVAVAQYVPMTVTLPASPTLGQAPGTITIATNYPFDEVVNVTVVSTVDALPVALRIPGWAIGAMLAVNGGSPMPVSNGTMHKVRTLVAPDL